MNKDYNKSLDFILTEIINRKERLSKLTPENLFITEEREIPIKDFITNELSNQGIEIWEIPILFEQLIKDGMIKDDSCTNISLKGADLIKNQFGYSRIRKNEAEKTRRDELYAKLSSYGAIFAAVATSLLLILEGIKFLISLYEKLYQ